MTAAGSPSGDARPRTLRSLGVVVHPARPGARELGAELARWTEANGVRLCALAGERSCLDEVATDAAYRDDARFAAGLDLVVALGGDGTLLRAAGLALEHEVPVLGVNLGRLGFLTEVEPHDLTAALDAVQAGRYRTERRMTLRVDASGGRAGGGRDGRVSALAVNDVVLEKAARHRLAGVAVRIDGRLFASYAADGLIVATPTGSTAYSFSAGGPIVSPLLDALILTPIAPHMVFNRSLLLHPDQVLRLEVLPGSAGVDVSVDGNPVGRLLPGAVVEVRKGARDARLVRLDHTDFFRRVRSKFQLADAVHDIDVPADPEPQPQGYEP